MRPRLSSLAGLVAVACVAAASLAVPATAADDDPDPLSILPGRGVAEQLGLGTDTVTVFICDIAAADPLLFTFDGVIPWANDVIAPYFETISGGRLQVDFVRGEEFVADFSDCLDEALDRTSTSNSMVIVRDSSNLGFARSGLASVFGGEVIAATLADPASATRRGFLVGGGVVFGRDAIAAHELGHTLGWPHSGSTNLGFADTDYDNQYDLVSGGGAGPAPFDNYCDLIGPCEIIHTLAINRYASGWIDADEIEVVLQPMAGLELSAPALGGRQMALLPTPDPLVFHTLEARPNVGYDAVLPKGGVIVHTLDLGFDCAGPWSICWGTTRRQRPAVPAIDSSAHVIGVGESLTLDGLTVTVDAATADGFRIDVTGTPTGCAFGINPFGDVSTGSFAFDSVNCIWRLGITNGTSATTYSPAASVTREQMAAFLARLWRTLGNGCTDEPSPFEDLGTSFAVADVACIFDLEVTTGTTSTTYSPAATVTREQMAAFLARLWRALGNDCPDEPSPFTDLAATSFAIEDAGCIFHLGITTGTGPGTYSPANTVTREQMAAFLERFWQAALAA
ncbi:MAG: S-layer homology domain-containing protein [Actinomycetota bacterium]